MLLEFRMKIHAKFNIFVIERNNIIIIKRFALQYLILNKIDIAI